MRHATALLAVGVVLAAAVVVIPTPTPARALTIPSPVCTIAGLFSGLAGTACKGLRAGGELLSKGKGLFTGAGATAARSLGIKVVIAGIVLWVTGAAQASLKGVAHVMSWSTRPQLESSWFSASYWRMAAIALLLTIPFLLAACVQAMLRSDLAMIGQAALGYLPLAILAIMIAAPVTTLLLAASDELCTLISSAAGSAPGAALSKLTVGSAATMLSGSSFVALVVALITIAAAMTLWIELLIRSAAVYVIVLMLPVLFAALVWPARRVWAVRGVELLVALILSKFAIVAVLSLGASAIGQGVLGGIRTMAGATLVLLAAFSPWAVIRLIPLHELAAGAAAWTPHLRDPVNSAFGAAGDRAVGAAEGAPAVGPGGIRDAAHALVAGLGSGGRRQPEVLMAQADGWGAPSPGDAVPRGAVDGRLDDADPDSAAPAGDERPPTVQPAEAAPVTTAPASTEGPPPDDPPAPAQRPAPVHEFHRESIRFGDDFEFRPPEPGGVAPQPIENPPAPPAEPERVEPPMPPDDEHGTGPL